MLRGRFPRITSIKKNLPRGAVRHDWIP